jgi:hypothetical protein
MDEKEREERKANKRAGERTHYTQKKWSNDIMTEGRTRYMIVRVERGH